MQKRSWVAVLMVLATFATACAEISPEELAERYPSDVEVTSAPDASGDTTGDIDDEFADEPSTADDLSTDVCSPQLIGASEGPVTSVYAIEDGVLAGLCFGDPDEAVTGGFEFLEKIFDASDLDEIAYIGGFESTGSTLAFVVPVDWNYQQFVIAIDTISAVDNPELLELTILHEFAHVFTQTNDQLDITVRSRDCSALWNGAGCFIPGSYIESWTQEFWTKDELRTLPLDGAGDPDGADQRCAADSSFIGWYAATSPEEDFAETYSAFILDVEVSAATEPRFEWFESYPEFVAQRDRAEAAGLTPAPYLFDRCG